MTTTELKEYIRQHPNMSDREVGKCCGYSRDAVQWHRQQLGIWRDKTCTIDETGNKYGKLTVLYKDPSPHDNGAHWVCKCDCGNITSVRGADLRSSRPIRSCGCDSTKGGRIILWENGVWKRIDETHIQCCKCGKIKPKGKKTRSYTVMCDCTKEEIRAEKMKKYCVYCGALLPNRKRRVCDECNHKHEVEKRREHQRRRGTLSERRRYKRAKQNGKIDWSISLEKLMERDGNICALCGKPVDVNDYHVTDDGAFITHMKYPSIDHVLPLSKGGTHTWDNVQLAHFICNSLKSNTVEREGA